MPFRSWILILKSRYEQCFHMYPPFYFPCDTNSLSHCLYCSVEQVRDVIWCSSPHADEVIDVAPQIFEIGWRVSQEFFHAVKEKCVSEKDRDQAVHGGSAPLVVPERFSDMEIVLGENES